MKCHWSLIADRFAWIEPWKETLEKEIEVKEAVSCVGLNESITAPCKKDTPFRKKNVKKGEITCE